MFMYVALNFEISYIIASCFKNENTQTTILYIISYENFIINIDASID